MYLHIDVAAAAVAIAGYCCCCCKPRIRRCWRRIGVSVAKKLDGSFSKKPTVSLSYFRFRFFPFHFRMLFSFVFVLIHIHCTLVIVRRIAWFSVNKDPIYFTFTFYFIFSHSLFLFLFVFFFFFLYEFDAFVAPCKRICHCLAMFFLFTLHSFFALFLFNFSFHSFKILFLFHWQTDFFVSVSRYFTLPDTSRCAFFSLFLFFTVLLGSSYRKLLLLNALFWCV